MRQSRKHEPAAPPRRMRNNSAVARNTSTATHRSGVTHSSPAKSNPPKRKKTYPRSTQFGAKPAKISRAIRRPFPVQNEFFQKQLKRSEARDIYRKIQEMRSREFPLHRRMEVPKYETQEKKDRADSNKR